MEMRNIIDLEIDSAPDTSSQSSVTAGRDTPDSEPSFHENDFMSDEDFDLYVTGLALSATISNPQSGLHLHSIPRQSIPKYTAQGRTFTPGKSVELNDGTFLRITKLLEGQDGVVFCGRRLERLETMDSLMPDRLNELCWIVDRGGQYTDDEIEVPLEDVKRLRIIRLTNRPYTPESTNQFQSLSECREQGYLFCRLKYIRTWNNKNRVVEDAIEYLAPEECVDSISSNVLRQKWRGERGDNQCHYTFGDGFCGGGGVSRGAAQAGLQLSWAFDHNVAAMNSYRLNFPDSIGETCDVADFLTNRPEDVRVVILHLSPPCQPFSPAKTIAAATDDANQACIFSIHQLLELIKPRIVTMEETSGLIERHKEFLYATIHTFVELGYSVRWKVLQSEEFGVPQRRKRLIIIASGPGETLPPFPLPTHGPSSNNLSPYVTIMDAIGDIPSSAPNHDLDRAQRSFFRQPYDPDTLAKTITCNGGDNVHPSGTRTFTHRELASLQTFPIEHQFCAPGVMKQIGNAVPPVLAKAIFMEVLKSLRRTDATVID
ncbi:hypothetical protein FQN57_002394 [Myotisia sp. PD_48]|nr:hypothetical protein FQN57_002394 [Myotisia sp. PD_48]